jgi:hypothetical protein
MVFPSIFLFIAERDQSARLVWLANPANLAAREEPGITLIGDRWHQARDSDSAASIKAHG